MYVHIIDVELTQPVKDVAPHVRETTVKFTSDESSCRIHYTLDFFFCCELRCSSQQAVGVVDTTGNKIVD